MHHGWPPQLVTPLYVRDPRAGEARGPFVVQGEGVTGAPRTPPSPRGSPRRSADRAHRHRVELEAAFPPA